MIEQTKKALLVIDMQNDFLNTDGPFGDRDKEGLPASLVQNVITLIEWARADHIPVIHVYQEHRKELVDYGRELDKSKIHCVEGTNGAEIISEIEVLESDYRVIKRRFSGFFATDLDLLLKGLGVERLILCGIAGDGCVRATAVDAHQLGYRFQVIREAVAGLTRKSCEEAMIYLSGLQNHAVISINELD